MALYALENVDDAFDVTREFLTSIGRRAWVKLALVVLFVGGVGGGFPSFGFQGSGGSWESDAPPGDAGAVLDPGPDLWLVVAALVAVALAVGLAVAVVGAIMEFVFVESLRTGRVTVREYWGRHWRKGVRLFGFRLVVGAVTLGLWGAFALLFIGPLLFDTAVFGASLLLALVLFPFLVVVSILLGLVSSFTTMFVVPLMLLEGRGVLAGWRRLWPTIRAQWKQYLAYAVGAWVLSFAGGLIVSIVGAVIAVVLLFPFGILVAIGIGLLSVVEPVAIAWFVVVGLLAAAVGLLVLALVQMPVQTYLRYYALLVLGDVEPDFDVVPDRRTAVREPDADDSVDVA